MPGLDRPAGRVVVADRGAVVIRLRTLAAHLEKAPALAMAFVAPGLHIAAGIVVGAALALVVDQLPVGKQRAVVCRPARAALRR